VKKPSREKLYEEETRKLEIQARVCSIAIKDYGGLTEEEREEILERVEKALRAEPRR